MGKLVIAMLIISGVPDFALDCSTSSIWPFSSNPAMCGLAKFLTEFLDMMVFIKVAVHVDSSSLQLKVMKLVLASHYLSKFFYWFVGMN